KLIAYPIAVEALSLIYNKDLVPNPPIFAGGITKFLFCPRPWSQVLCPHPPASSPIKKPGGGGFTPVRDRA
ncbi:hypothetical protein GFK19_19705, partial [Salmonella enterica subsp. enterica serovar Enteritidis]|nr:hypothetical protein [Salmonella enterica subsp. enterica serovar Enteritidis]